MRLDREKSAGPQSRRQSVVSGFSALRRLGQRTLSLLLLSPLLAYAALPSAETEEVDRLIREQKLTEAAASAARLVANNPDNAQAHALLGRVRLAQKDGPAARTAFERASQLDPTNSEIQRGLGDACASALETSGLLAKFRLARDCRAAYERAVQLDPANHAARFNLVGFLAGAPAFYGGSMDKAWEHAAELKRLAPASGHLALGMLHAADKEFDRAFADFEAAVRFDPANYMALYQIGRLAVLSGQQVERGLHALQQALALPAATGAPGHDAAHWRLGMLHELKGDRTAARIAYESSLRLNPAFEKAADALAKLN